MPSSGMLRRVALVRTDISEELSASINWVTRIGEVGITLAVTSNRHTLRRITIFCMALRSSETSVLTRVTRRNMQEDAILQD
jgi:predicted HAD superfamily phosphohydrolase YqeG